MLGWEWWVLTHVRVGVVGICTLGWEWWVLTHVRVGVVGTYTC